MSNLFLAYDLMVPGQNYEAVQTRIEQLGQWYKLQYSLFYVQTVLSAEQAHGFVRSAMDQNDKLVVIDANNAWVNNVPGDHLARLRAVFNGNQMAA